MTQNTFVHILRLFGAVISLLFVQGCANNGYITSSVATVVGLDVSENPKTQVPHVKFGYARTGLYYVPTGKTAYGNPRQQSAADAAANKDSVKDTPTLVSEIFVHSKFLSGMTISEKFAIGDAAVKSAAAVTAFANNSAHAVAANGAVAVTSAAPSQLPPRGSDTKVSAAKAKENEDKGRTESTDDALRRPGANAVLTLEKEAKQKGKPVDYPKIIKAITGTEPASATRTDYLKALNTITTQKQSDDLLAEVVRQQGSR